MARYVGTISGKSTSFTPSSILFRPRRCGMSLLGTRPHGWRRRVLPPGPKGLLRRPFITIATLAGGTPNIGRPELRRKACPPKPDGRRRGARASRAPSFPRPACGERVTRTCAPGEGLSRSARVPVQPALRRCQPARASRYRPAESEHHVGDIRSDGLGRLAGISATAGNGKPRCRFAHVGCEASALSLTLSRKPVRGHIAFVVRCH